jgi:hypothetical protein
MTPSHFLTFAASTNFSSIMNDTLSLSYFLAFTTSVNVLKQQKCERVIRDGFDIWKWIAQ